MERTDLVVLEGGKMDKKQALEQALAQIDKTFGKGSIMRLGANDKVDIEAISTGSLSLDTAREASDALTAAVQRLGERVKGPGPSTDAHVSVVNTQLGARSGFVEVPLSSSLATRFATLDSPEGTGHGQVSSDGRRLYALVPEIPSVGYKAFSVRTIDAIDTPRRVTWVCRDALSADSPLPRGRARAPGDGCTLQNSRAAA